jgi:hypothetical protein
MKKRKGALPNGYLCEDSPPLGSVPYELPSFLLIIVKEITKRKIKYGKLFPRWKCSEEKGCLSRDIHFILS